MLFWLIWGAGIICFVFTRCKITKELKPFAKSPEHTWQDPIQAQVSEVPSDTRLFLHIFVYIAIILGPGLFIANIISIFDSVQLWSLIFIGMLAFIAYYVTYLILGLRFDNKKSHISFLCVFIISAICWLFLINAYNQNVEYIKDVETVNWTGKWELIDFCGIPVQNLSGEIDMSSGLISENASGSINTTYELTYWYVNENGEWVFNAVPTDDSVAVPIEEGETPYIIIKSYHKCYAKYIDHNINFEIERYPWDYTKYVFHIPEEVIHSMHFS